MKYKKLAIVIILIALSSCAFQFDYKRYNNLIEYYKKWGCLSIEPGFAKKITQEIKKNSAKDIVLVDYSDDIKIYVKKDIKRKKWVPEGFLRTKLPNRCNYKENKKFIIDITEYYAAQWILKNLNKPYFYCPACPPVKNKNGIWITETGPAVIAGPGLLIQVDDNGKLIKIEEIFNPD
ncbi:MAG: hypothetical protein V1701_07870 [Planctomycetota bacterium]